MVGGRLGTVVGKSVGCVDGLVVGNKLGTVLGILEGAMHDGNVIFPTNVSLEWSIVRDLRLIAPPKTKSN